MAGRVTQDVVEVGILPDSSVVRVTQDVVEVGIVPTSAVARVSQYVVEVAVIDPTYGQGRARAFVIG